MLPRGRFSGFADFSLEAQTSVHVNLLCCKENEIPSVATVVPQSKHLSAFFPRPFLLTQTELTVTPGSVILPAPHILTPPVEVAGLWVLTLVKKSLA